MLDPSFEEAPKPSKFDAVREMLELSRSGKLRRASEDEQQSEQSPRRARMAAVMGEKIRLSSPRHRIGSSKHSL